MSSYTSPSAYQWYATADELINQRNWYSINGVPIPTRPQDGTQQGYYPTIDDKQADRNYEMFYDQQGGRINKYGVKAYWTLREKYIPLQQQISDRYDIITYKPDERKAQVKTKGNNTAVSTRPPRRTPIKQPAPIVLDTLQHEFEEQLRLEAGGEIPEIVGTSIDTSGNAYPQTFFQVIPQAEAEKEKEVEKFTIPIREDNGDVTMNMINQHLDYFTIENGRAKGQITFRINDNFNPYYYGKNITNIITFKTKEGVNILSTPKQNRLRFTETERDEVIQYNENMQENTIADLESFVWSSATNPNAFSAVLREEIKEGRPAEPTKDGFMAMGITGAIALLIGIGLILPDRVRRKK